MARLALVHSSTPSGRRQPDYPDVGLSVTARRVAAGHGPGICSAFTSTGARPGRAFRPVALSAGRPKASSRPWPTAAVLARRAHTTRPGSGPSVIRSRTTRASHVQHPHAAPSPISAEQTDDRNVACSGRLLACRETDAILLRRKHPCSRRPRTRASGRLDLLESPGIRAVTVNSNSGSSAGRAAPCQRSRRACVMGNRGTRGSGAEATLECHYGCR